MATIFEIAEKANVSIGTVDRVLHNRGRVSKETERRVRRIIKELDYTPNIFARNLSLKKTYSFAGLIPKPYQDGRYWELPVKGILKAVQELKIYNIQFRFYHYDKYSERSFYRAYKKILTSIQEYNGLIIAPVLLRSAEMFIKKIPGDLPYVFVDSYVPKTSCLSAVGQDAFQSGILSAKLMQLSSNNGGTIAVIRVLPEDYHIDDRVRGFLSFFKESESDRVKVYDANREKDTNIFTTVTRKILNENSDLQGIFIPSACAYLVANYIKKIGKHRNLTILGYDLVDENIKFIEDGTLDFIISQRPEIQGYQAVYTLYKHIVLREEVEKSIQVPLDIITKENVNYYQSK